jgi:outer membrane protein TolC
MIPRHCKRALRAPGLVALIALTCLGLIVLPGWSEPPAELPAPRERLTLSPSAAVQWALERNPNLATLRRQRGIAEAGVAIARQYPFNPIVQDFVWSANGPPEAFVTNHCFNEHTMRLDLELLHQGRYRRATARAALSRTEWEIAAQELLTSVVVVRAFNNVLYRQAKYKLLEEIVQFQEQTAERIGKLVEQGKMTSADHLFAKADVAEARNALGPARSLLVVAENDLRRGLGMLQEDFAVDGTLERGFVTPEPTALAQAALERRPDLHGFEFAVQEAEHRLRFEIANRWGNPSLGPGFEFNETSVAFVGMWLIWQPPIFNQRRGEIRQRVAERARAIQAVQQSEIQVQQDVFAGLNRLAAAERLVNSLRNETLPQLRKTREDIDKLFAQNQPGVDLTRVIDVRRRLLRVRDLYIDALWELSQAQADLSAAVADLSFAGAAPPAEKDKCEVHPRLP